MAASRKQALDGLRGVAALNVALFHGILHYDLSLIDRVLYRPFASIAWADWPAKLLLVVFNGETSVIAFFVLSGFVLSGSFARMADRPFLPMALRFAGLRALRIYPAVIACMAALFGLSVLAARFGVATFPHFTARQFADNAALLSPAMHGPSWSVQVEVMAVPFLLAAEWLRRRFGVAGLVCAAVYGLVAIEYPVLVSHLPSLWPYLFMFFIGALAASPGVAASAAGFRPGTGMVAAVLFVAARHVTDRAAISGLVAQALAGGLLVASLAYHRDRLWFALTRPACLFLGRISYSFYLLNVIALYACWAAIDAFVARPADHAMLWGLGSGLASVVLTLPFAMLSERFVERPWLGRAASPARTTASPARDFA